MYTNNFQQSLSLAVSLHRALKLSDLGKDSFETWESLVADVASAAYSVYACTHDAAGRPAVLVDESAKDAAMHALAKSLRPVVAMVGNVAFKGMEGEALLEVNEALLSLVEGISWVKAWNYSEEVQAIDDELDSLKDDIAAAKWWVEYYSTSDNEAAKAKYAKELTQLEVKKVELQEKRKQATAKEGGKVRTTSPATLSAFRKEFESELMTIVQQQNQTPYAVWQAKEAAKKAKRNARTAERRKAKKQREQEAAKASK